MLCSWPYFTNQKSIINVVRRPVHPSVGWHQCLNHWTDFSVKVKMWDFNKSCWTPLIFIHIDANISCIKSSVYHKASTFKWPMFAYVNTCKNTPLKIHIIYSGNKEIYCIFKTCCINSVLFPITGIYFIILSFSVQVILVFFINHVLNTNPVI